MKKIAILFFCFLFVSQYTQAQTINAPTECETSMEVPFYIKVKWNDNSNNENGFYIERATSLITSNWETIGAAGQNNRTFFDYWLTKGTKYYYRVYAYNDVTVSDYSNIDSVIATGDTTSIPARPTYLTVSNVTMTSITINWSDNSYNELGFIIARKKPGDIAFEYIDTVQTDILTYQEVGLNPDNIYFYKVCAFNDYGVSDFSNTVSATTKANTSVSNTKVSDADGYYLADNFPNPFNPVTTIKFGIPVNSFVSLKIYNSAGNEVETLLNSKLSSGSYSFNWNATGYSSGVYFYRLETNKFSNVKKMILVK